MSEIDQATLSFIQIKISCNQIMETPSVTNIDRLDKVLNTLPLNVVKHDIKNYVIFVIFSKLKEVNESSNLQLSLTKCLLTLLPHVTIDETILQSLLLCLTSVMYDPQHEDLLFRNVPEELHLQCMKCINILMKMKSSNILYGTSLAPALGVIVCICLKQAARKHLKCLRIEAIECLMSCAKVADSDEDQNKQQAANVFMNFIPGIAKGLQNIISGDEKQGHLITMLAIRAWGRILALVFDDSDINFETMSELNENTYKDKTKDIREIFTDNKRTSVWYSNANKKLISNVRLICQASRNDSHPAVRKEISTITYLLITKCSKSLSNSMPELFETLLILSEDEYPDVSNYSKLNLNLLMDNNIYIQNVILFQSLQEKFYECTNNILEHFVYSGVKEQNAQIRLLLGYLKLFQEKLSQIFLLSSHWDVLIRGLLQIITLDTTSVVSLTNSAVKHEFQILNSNEYRSWCKFKYFTDFSILKQVFEMCEILSKNGDVKLISSQLIDLFNDNNSQKCEIAFILNAILNNELEDKTEHFEIIRKVFKTYLNSENWKIPINSDELCDVENNINLSTLRRNIVLVCIMTDGLSSLTIVLGNLGRRLLPVILYPCLERSGSSVSLISEAGNFSLMLLSKAFLYNNPSDLIRGESDYLIHPILIGLKRPIEHPEVLSVLAAVVMHSSKEILPLIETVITCALTESCDENQYENMTSYLKVFHCFVWNLSKWLNDSETEVKISDVNIISHNYNVVEEILTRHNYQMETGEEFTDHETVVEEKELCSETEVDEVKKNHPNYIKMTEEIMSRCIHMLPSPIKERQLLSLSILKIAIEILTPYEDVLLPIVHKIWSPLCRRFSPSQDIVVLRHSFELLCKMSNSAKNFLRQRTLDQVMPSITNFLRKQSLENRKQKNEIFSQIFKLQVCALNGLGQLCVDLQLLEQDVYEVMYSSAMYLCSYQPPQLQESAVKLFETLSKLYPDNVWVFLHSLWCPSHEIHSPCDNLFLVKFPKDRTQNEIFKKNCELLFSKL